MEIRRERHRVWSLSYHAVFVVKYRKPCITDEIADFLLDEIRYLLEGWGGELIEGKADKDHLHLLFSLPPDKELARYIGLMKQVSARQVRKKYKEQLKEYLWGDSFWTDSYYLSSTGGANLENISRNKVSLRESTSARMGCLNASRTIHPSLSLAMTGSSRL